MLKNCSAFYVEHIKTDKELSTRSLLFPETANLKGVSRSKMNLFWDAFPLCCGMCEMQYLKYLCQSETRTFRRPSLTANRSEAIPEEGVAEYLAIVGESPRNSCNSNAGSSTL